MDRIFVKPRAGVKVRYPDPPYVHLPAEGAEVPESSYWVRRLQDGDVEQAAPAVIVPAPPTTQPEPSGATKSKGGRQ